MRFAPLDEVAAVGAWSYGHGSGNAGCLKNPTVVALDGAGRQTDKVAVGVLADLTPDAVAWTVRRLVRDEEEDVESRSGLQSVYATST